VLILSPRDRSGLPTLSDLVRFFGSARRHLAQHFLVRLPLPASCSRFPVCYYRASKALAQFCAATPSALLSFSCDNVLLILSYLFCCELLQEVGIVLELPD
jgi:hypothetical protein